MLKIVSWLPFGNRGSFVPFGVPDGVRTKQKRPEKLSGCFCFGHILCAIFEDVLAILVKIYLARTGTRVVACGSGKLGPLGVPVIL